MSSGNGGGNGDDCERWRGRRGESCLRGQWRWVRPLLGQLRHGFDFDSLYEPVLLRSTNMFHDGPLMLKEGLELKLLCLALCVAYDQKLWSISSTSWWRKCHQQWWTRRLYESVVE